MPAQFPELRLRRMRRTPAIRRMTAVRPYGLAQMLWPVFVCEGKNVMDPIPSMPGQYHYSVDALIRELAPLVDAGLGGILVFGCIDDSLKNDNGAAAWRSDGVVQQAVSAVKQAYPALVVFTDVCLCAYTTHGHCGSIDDLGHILNDETLEGLAKTAVSHAHAGADGVAPSAMMDGQIRAIRAALDDVGNIDTILMAYSTKFASAMYGPFRDAAGSAPGKGDRKTYQADQCNLRNAMLESMLDEAEGADILMVKPALFYLDVIARLREQTLLPIAAYNVSGEYAMVHAAAARGWGDLQGMADESLNSIQRAGADLIITYWANQFLNRG